LPTDNSGLRRGGETKLSFLGGGGTASGRSHRCKKMAIEYGPKKKRGKRAVSFFLARSILVVDTGGVRGNTPAAAAFEKSLGD